MPGVHKSNLFFMSKISSQVPPFSLGQQVFPSDSSPSLLPLPPPPLSPWSLGFRTQPHSCSGLWTPERDGCLLIQSPLQSEAAIGGEAAATSGAQPALAAGWLAVMGFTACMLPQTPPSPLPAPPSSHWDAALSSTYPEASLSGPVQRLATLPGSPFPPPLPCEHRHHLCFYGCKEASEASQPVSPESPNDPVLRVSLGILASLPRLQGPIRSPSSIPEFCESRSPFQEPMNI